MVLLTSSRQCLCKAMETQLHINKCQLLVVRGILILKTVLYEIRDPYYRAANSSIHDWSS